MGPGELKFLFANTIIQIWKQSIFEQFKFDGLFNLLNYF